MDFGQWSALAVVVGIVMALVGGEIEHRIGIRINQAGAVLAVLGAVSCVFVAADIFTVSWR